MTAWAFHSNYAFYNITFFKHVAKIHFTPNPGVTFVTMVSLNKITVEFTDKTLFDEIGFLITRQDRIGLTGRNGAGKSTLLKILAGKQKPDVGEVAVSGDCTIGYLPQELDLEDKYILREEMERSIPEIVYLEETIDRINLELTTRTDYESDVYMELIQKLNDANDRYGIVGGYTFRADIERIMLGLGFKSTDFEAHTSTFSGGWRMRIELAKLLLQKHDLLLLDEPTNHLDIESILWLENFLKDYPGGIVLVSHDRAFLDQVTNRTIELSLGRAYDFPVSYSKYVALRQEQRTLQMAARKNQEKEIKQTEQLIERFRYKASKASFAQSLIKKLDKMDVIEVEEVDNKQMKFRFPPAPRSGKVAVLCEKVTKSFDVKTVLKGIDLEVERHDKIAFVGQNGQGKSTLVKIITGALQAEGSIQLGHNVQLGYYAQNQADALNGEITLLKTIEDAAPEELRPRARDLLGAFMFSGEQVEKKVKVLSGGEKGRLALCKLLLQPINLLIMDEPTNHLDMRAKDVLKQALLNFDGTLILVSHDRDFLNGLSTKTYEFRDGKIKSYLGDIQFFLDQKQAADFRQIEKKKEEKREIKQQNPFDKASTLLKKEKEKSLKQLEKRLDNIMVELENAEALLAAWDAQLADSDKFKKLSSEEGFYAKYDAQKAKIATLISNWESCEAELEKVKAEFA